MIVDTTAGMVTFSNSRACTSIIVPIEEIRDRNQNSDESFDEDSNIGYWVDHDGEVCVVAYETGTRISVWMTPAEGLRFAELIA